MHMPAIPPPMITTAALSCSWLPTGTSGHGRVPEYESRPKPPRCLGIVSFGIPILVDCNVVSEWECENSNWVNVTGSDIPK